MKPNIDYEQAALELIGRGQLIGDDGTIRNSQSFVEECSLSVDGVTFALKRQLRQIGLAALYGRWSIEYQGMMGGGKIVGTIGGIAELLGIADPHQEDINQYALDYFELFRILPYRCPEGFALRSNVYQLRKITDTIPLVDHEQHESGLTP